MMTVNELRELQAEEIRAKISAQKALATKLRAEGTYTRRKDSVLAQEIREYEASTYEQRILEFSKEITEESVNETITTLSEWRSLKAKEITFRIVSPGGECIAGFALYDYILSLRSEGIVVNTVALGWAASMSGILLQAGTKRYIAPNAHILIHNLTVQLPDLKLPDIEDEIVFIKMLEKRGTEILAERSKLSLEEIEERMERKNWWFGAQEAVKLGFADSLWPPKRRGKK